MKTIEIKNEYVLSKLDAIENILLNLDRSNLKLPTGLELKDEKLSENYLHDIINRGRIHDGYPEILARYENPSSPEFDNDIYQHNCDLVEYMCCPHKSLRSLYPPKAYCSWHNNANASGYGIMFSWSETGEGDFRYWDLNKEEVIVIPDKKGWNVKHFYFGGYDDPEKLVYHACSNECLRYTMSFNFFDAKEIWEDTIEILTNHE